MEEKDNENIIDDWLMFEGREKAMRMVADASFWLLKVDSLSKLHIVAFCLEN